LEYTGDLIDTIGNQRLKLHIGDNKRAQWAQLKYLELTSDNFRIRGNKNINKSKTKYKVRAP